MSERIVDLDYTVDFVYDTLPNFDAIFYFDVNCFLDGKNNEACRVEFPTNHVVNADPNGGMTVNAFRRLFVWPKKLDQPIFLKPKRGTLAENTHYAAYVAEDSIYVCRANLEKNARLGAELFYKAHLAQLAENK